MFCLQNMISNWLILHAVQINLILFWYICKSSVQCLQMLLLMYKWSWSIRDIAEYITAQKIKNETFCMWMRVCVCTSVCACVRSTDLNDSKISFWERQVQVFQRSGPRSAKNLWKDKIQLLRYCDLRDLLPLQ